MGFSSFSSHATSPLQGVERRVHGDPIGSDALQHHPMQPGLKGLTQSEGGIYLGCQLKTLSFERHL